MKVDTEAEVLTPTQSATDRREVYEVHHPGVRDILCIVHRGFARYIKVDLRLSLTL